MTVNSVPGMSVDVKARPATQQDLEVRFLRVSQFSRVTNMPQPTVFRFIQTGELKAYRRGRSLFIPVEEVDRFIAAESAA
jgi:excisionase family DNA binding protein